MVIPVPPRHTVPSLGDVDPVEEGEVVSRYPLGGLVTSRPHELAFAILLGNLLGSGEDLVLSPLEAVAGRSRRN